MHVLLVKMSSFGDIVHVLPAVDDAVRRGVRFDWVVEEAFAPLPLRVRGVDTVLPVAFRRWRHRPFTCWGQVGCFHRRLRARRYDLALDAQSLAKSAVVMRWAKARERCGLDFASARERIAALAYDTRLSAPPGEHAIARWRRVFAAAFGYDAPCDAPRFGLRRTAAARGDCVVLAHGTTWASKHWPEPYWIDVALRIAGAGLTPLLPWHGGERARAERIAAAVPDARLCAPTSIADLMDLVQTCRGVIGVDSGLGHLGAAFGRPTVMLFGPTDPRLTGVAGALSCNLAIPNNPAAHLPCAPCRQRRCRYNGAAVRWNGEAVGPACLAAVTPDRAFAALAELLRRERADGC